MTLTIGTVYSQTVALLNLFFFSFFFNCENMDLRLFSASFQLLIVSHLPLLFLKDVKYTNSKAFGYGDKPNINTKNSQLTFRSSIPCLYNLLTFSISEWSYIASLASNLISTIRKTMDCIL
jgi:hypothetical protein